jgi:hypothetical protein
MDVVVEFPRAKAVRTLTQAVRTLEPYRPDPERREWVPGDLNYYFDFGNWLVSREGALYLHLQGAMFIAYQCSDGWRWCIKWDGVDEVSKLAYATRGDARDWAWRKWCAIRSAKEA